MGELAKEGLALDRSEAGQKPGARLNIYKKKKSLTIRTIFLTRS